MTDVLSLLKNPNPEKRKQGIRLLVQGDYPDAVNYLAALYKRDSDVTVREMALKAGRYLKEQAAQAEASYSDDYDYAYGAGDDYEDEEYIETAPQTKTNPNKNKEVAAKENKKKTKAKNDEVKEVTWADVLLDLLLYSLVSAAATFIILMFMAHFVQNINQAFLYSLNPILAEEFNKIVADTTLTAMMMSTLSSVGTSLIAYLIWAELIHIAATFMLAGDGTYKNLIHEMSLPMIIGTILTTVVILGAFYAAFSGFPTDPKILENPVLLSEAMQDVGATFNIMNCVNLFLVVGLSVWLALGIAKGYEFGLGKGCRAVLISYFIIFIFACGCSFFSFFTLTPSATPIP